MPFSIDNLRKFQTLQAKERSREADELRELRALKAKETFNNSSKSTLRAIGKTGGTRSKNKKCRTKATTKYIQ